MEQQFELEITERGYLVVPAEIAGRLFPEDACVAMAKEDKLWVMPINGSASGGLMMKQRNLAGDKSVLVWEAIMDDYSSGMFPAAWDENEGALKVDYKKRDE